MAGRIVKENDLLAIGRPARQYGSERRVAELEPLAAVHFADPESCLWVAYIGHRLAILREADAIRRNPGEKWHERSGLGIIARQFPARQRSHHEQLLAILAGLRGEESHGAGGKLHGLAIGFSK